MNRKRVAWQPQSRGFGAKSAGRSGAIPKTPTGDVSREDQRGWKWICPARVFGQGCRGGVCEGKLIAAVGRGLLIGGPDVSKPAFRMAVAGP